MTVKELIAELSQFCPDYPVNANLAGYINDGKPHWQARIQVRHMVGEHEVIDDERDKVGTVTEGDFIAIY